MQLFQLNPSVEKRTIDKKYLRYVDQIVFLAKNTKSVRLQNTLWQLQNAHSQQTGGVNRIMVVGPHGKQHVATRRQPFHPHSHIHTHTHTHTHTLMHRHRGSVNERDIYCTERENRYLHKGLHLVSLRWRWWGEGWPVNMKRYTHYLSVWGWQHTDVMRHTHHHSGAKWTDAMGTVGESPWGWDCVCRCVCVCACVCVCVCVCRGGCWERCEDWEWGLGQRDRCLLTATARRPAVNS